MKYLTIRLKMPDDYADKMHKELRRLKQYYADSPTAWGQLGISPSWIRDVRLQDHEVQVFRYHQPPLTPEQLEDKPDLDQFVSKVLERVAESIKRDLKPKTSDEMFQANVEAVRQREVERTQRDTQD